MKCKKCGNNYCKMCTSSSTKGKDYSIGKGLIGELFFGSPGYALGFSNSRSMNVDAIWVCPKCGFKFKA